MAKTWKQKLNDGRKPEVEVLPRSYGGMAAGDQMLISTPGEVDAELRTIPAGEALTIPEFRTRLARKHGAAGTCPMTTSIFLRIVAEVALEDLAEGKKDVAPFWRVVDAKSPVAKKLSCGPDEVARLREVYG